MVLKRCLLWGSSALFPMGWGSLIRITDAAFFKMCVSKHTQPLSPPPAHSLSQAFDELRKDGGHHYMEKSIQGDPDFNPNPCVHIAITWEAFKATQSHTQCRLSQIISGRSQAVFKAPLRIPIAAKLGQRTAWWEGRRESLLLTIAGTLSKSVFTLVTLPVKWVVELNVITTSLVLFSLYASNSLILKSIWRWNCLKPYRSTH